MRLLTAFFIGAFFVLAAFPSLAIDQIIYVRGTGYASGFCQPPSEYFCMDNLEYKAERDGQLDADRQCQIQNGDLQSTFGCTTFCSPSYIPPDGPGTHVSCNSSCHLPCRLQGNLQ